MKHLTMESSITFGNKKYQVSELIDDLIYLSSEEILEFYKGIGFDIPRDIRIGVFKHVLLMPVMQTRAQHATLANELGYQLSWFRKFTEFQLENLLIYYNSVSLNKKYLEELWLALLSYMVDQKVGEKELLSLFKKASNSKKVLPKDIQKFNWDLKEIFVDREGEIDGLHPDIFRPVLYKSSTIPEIRALGTKYGVNVPKRLRKKQLIEIMLKEMKKKNMLEADTEKKFKDMTIMQLHRFAIDNKIKVSIELKKEEIIEYILSNAEQTKSKYYVPSGRAAYEIELRDIKVNEEDEYEREIVEIEEKMIEAGEIKLYDAPVREEPYEEPVFEEEKEIKEEVKVEDQKVKHVTEEVIVTKQVVEKEKTLEKHDDQKVLVNTASFEADKNTYAQGLDILRANTKEANELQEKTREDKLSLILLIALIVVEIIILALLIAYIVMY